MPKHICRVRILLSSEKGVIINRISFNGVNYFFCAMPRTQISRHKAVQRPQWDKCLTGKTVEPTQKEKKKQKTGQDKSGYRGRHIKCKKVSGCNPKTLGAFSPEMFCFKAEGTF